MAAFYRTLLDLDVQVMPGPGLVLAGRSVRTGGPGHSPTVVSVGFANRSKGYRLLPDAVEHVLQHHRHARFLIHGIVAGSDAQNEQSSFDRLSTLGERVVVRQDVLAAEEYAAWLGQADLVLLPYDPDVYRSRGSGVFTEAQRLGIPVVATRGCAFAAPAFDSGWGVEITDYSSGGVARAVLAALGRLDQLSSSCCHRRPSDGRHSRMLTAGDCRQRSGGPASNPCRQGQAAHREKFLNPILRRFPMHDWALCYNLGVKTDLP